MKIHYLMIIIIFIHGVVYNMDLNNSKNNHILLIRKNIGVFIYDHVNNKINEIFSYCEEGEKIDVASLTVKKNNIHFNIYNLYKRVRNIHSGIYYEKEYSYNMMKNELFLFKEIENTITDSIWYIKETIFSKNGDKLNIVEQKRNELPELPKGPFPDESRIVNNIQVISKVGNLYIKNTNGEEKLLLKHRKDFSNKSPKFPWGYINPDLSRDGRKVICRDYHYTDKGFIKKVMDELRKNYKSFLIELNIQTMEQKLYAFEISVFDPKYSFSNQLLLFRKGGGLKEYCIYNFENKELKTIPKCDKAMWIY